MNQHRYPLVLKRGRMRMAPPPSEVEKAESVIMSMEKSESPSYRLIPSKTSVEQAKEFGLELTKSDVPLFVADRLAFASPKGPQLPLFLDKDDCITSYKRLRTAKSSLPQEPSIRTSTLLNKYPSSTPLHTALSNSNIGITISCYLVIHITNSKWQTPRLSRPAV